MATEVKNEEAVRNENIIAGSVGDILELIGEDPEREGLKATPDRVARMYAEIFSGYDDEPDEYLNRIFKCESDGIVVKKDISFFSCCEHHMVPFYGKCHIGYIPKDGKVVGISKLVRVVNAFARRLQIQEQLTAQIADCLYKHDELNPAGVVVVMEAQHLCEVMRGVKNPTTWTVTSEVRGLFKNDRQLEEKFFTLAGVGK